MTVSILIAVLGLALILAVALRADRQWRDRPRLPMNWKRPGQVTWTAPRRVALATVPVLAAVVLGLALVRPEGGLASPLAMSLLVLAFLALQAFYLRQIGRSR